MLAASTGCEVWFYSFPLGVRQVRAVALLAHGFGVFFGMNWLFTPKMRRTLSGFSDRWLTEIEIKTAS
jgi:hypothetical protein